jgi:hypothetical protein
MYAIANYTNVGKFLGVREREQDVGWLGLAIGDERCICTFSRDDERSEAVEWRKLLY